MNGGETLCRAQVEAANIREVSARESRIKEMYDRVFTAD